MQTNGTTPARPATLTPCPFRDGHYTDDAGRSFIAITRGKTTPRTTGYLQVFEDFDGSTYTVPGRSAWIPA